MKASRTLALVAGLLLQVSPARTQSAGTISGDYLLTVQPAASCNGLAPSYRIAVRASSTPLGARDEVHARAADGSDPEQFAIEMLRTRGHVQGPIGTTDVAVRTQEGRSSCCT